MNTTNRLIISGRPGLGIGNYLTSPTLDWGESRQVNSDSATFYQRLWVST
ncbi:MAG: hypothetical protein RID53_13140 [Coleofasciculus sp. B1-GNL1-01]